MELVPNLLVGRKVKAAERASNIAMKYTTNHNFNKPDYPDIVDVMKLNENMDIIDDLFLTTINSIRNGVTFTPVVKNGILSWTNDGGLPNPDPVKVVTAGGGNNSGEVEQSQFDDLVNRVNNLENTINTLRTSINNINATISSLVPSSSITTLQTNVTNLTSSLTSITNRVKALEDQKVLGVNT